MKICVMEQSAFAMGDEEHNLTSVTDAPRYNFYKLDIIFLDICKRLFII